jgi:8-oxo-dGTP pyrophosphatase MutT (NUDIX family)
VRLEYRPVINDGVTVAIANRKRLLLVKRISIPIFVIHPGMWYFVAGSRKGDESYLANAYREVLEETGIKKSDLKLLCQKDAITVFDSRRMKRWKNAFFVFYSKSDSVKLNFEHTAYKWVGIKELARHPLMEEFEREEILECIGQCIKSC